eukprot:jgi/Tetstr1/439470/TSEL_027903.t1
MEQSSVGRRSSLPLTPATSSQGSPDTPSSRFGIPDELLPSNRIQDASLYLVDARYAPPSVNGGSRVGLAAELPHADARFLPPSLQQANTTASVAALRGGRPGTISSARPSSALWRPPLSRCGVASAGYWPGDPLTLSHVEVKCTSSSSSESHSDDESSGDGGGAVVPVSAPPETGKGAEPDLRYDSQGSDLEMEALQDRRQALPTGPHTAVPDRQEHADVPAEGDAAEATASGGARARGTRQAPCGTGRVSLPRKSLASSGSGSAVGIGALGPGGRGGTGGGHPLPEGKQCDEDGPPRRHRWWQFWLPVCVMLLLLMLTAIVLMASGAISTHRCDTGPGIPGLPSSWGSTGLLPEGETAPPPPIPPPLPPPPPPPYTPPAQPPSPSSPVPPPALPPSSPVLNPPPTQPPSPASLPPPPPAPAPTSSDPPAPRPPPQTRLQQLQADLGTLLRLSEQDLTAEPPRPPPGAARRSILRGPGAEGCVDTGNTSPGELLQVAVSQLRSMGELVAHLSQEALGGGATPQGSSYGHAAALGATLQAAVGRAHNDTAALQAVRLDILRVQQSLEVRTRCFEPAQLDADFLAAFEGLPLTAPSSAADPGEGAHPVFDMDREIELVADGNTTYRQLAEELRGRLSNDQGVEAFLQPYADFLQVHGHAVLAGMDVGGRYQEWAYMDSALQSPARVMLLRACAQAVRLAGGSAVGGCSGAATGGSQQGAQHPAEMLSVRMAPQDTEGRLAGGLSPAGLAAFLAAAARQSVAVRRRFVAVWDALAPYYRQLCDPGSAEYFSMRACAALQRLGNLEAAYEGLLVRRCRRLETSDSLAYQGMMTVEGDGGAGAHALVRFRCAVLQAGCTRHRDCRAAAPGRCYCYGSSCIAAAAEVPFSAPPRRYASVQREQGSADPRQEPNDSCYWLAPSRVCRCKLADGNYYSPSQAGDDGTPLITLWQQITG